MSEPRILVAGIGNIFLGDDGFGVEVAQQLMRSPWPQNVDVVDFGIRGFDLAYAILDGYDTTIMVDALARGEAPGTLYLIEPELKELDEPGGTEIEAHSMHPLNVLHLVKALGGQPHDILVVGCEPATFGPENEGVMGLSEPVQAAMPEAMTMVREVVDKIINNQAAVLARATRSPA